MTVARNEPCPCGSGRRFKHCCGQQLLAPGAGAKPRPPQPAAAAAVRPLDAKELTALVGLIDQGQPRPAEERAAALLAAHPEAGIVWKIFGVAQLRQGKDALAALRRAAQLLPQDAEAHANLGSELHARGDWPAALASLRHAISLDSRNPDTLTEAADAQLALGHASEAVTLYQEALRLDGRRRDAWNNLGNALLTLGRAADAVRCYQRLLEFNPTDAEVQCNLGNALRELGQLDEALGCTRRAIALAPQLAMAHNNLGLLLAARGASSEALASYREALRLQPRYVEALSNLGRLLRERGQRREALAAFEQAVQLDDKRPEAHCQLGYALLDLRRPLKAAASFRSALALSPASSEARLGLAAAQRTQGRFAEAVLNCETVIAAEPRHARALAFLGELRADGGRFAEAQDLFQRALAVDPDCVAAYGGIAAQRRMKRADEAWLAGVKRALARPRALNERVHLHYALGKYFDDVADYEQAFASYREANELSKGQGERFDRAGLTRLVERLMSLGTAPATAEAQTQNSERAVFVIGMPRSGTSLTEQILASHPNVHGAGEVRFWDRTLPALAQREGGATDAALAQLAQGYLARVGSSAGGAQRVIDKMPANFLYAGVIHAALPRARFIHLRRDPLDTCVSVYFQNFLNVSPYANDLEDLTHYYREYLRIMEHWRRVLPSATLLEVPYEGLVAEPEIWTRRMLEFLGLPWDERCLQFHQTERVVITASKWQVRQKISAGSIGRWRHYAQHLGPLLELAAAGAS